MGTPMRRRCEVNLDHEALQRVSRLSSLRPRSLSLSEHRAEVFPAQDYSDWDFAVAKSHFLTQFGSSCLRREEMEHGDGPESSAGNHREHAPLPRPSPLVAVSRRAHAILS